MLSFFNSSVYDKFSIFTHLSQVNLLSQYKRRLVKNFAYLPNARQIYLFMYSQIFKKTPFTPMILKFYKPCVKFLFLKFEPTNSDTLSLPRLTEAVMSINSLSVNKLYI